MRTIIGTVLITALCIAAFVAGIMVQARTPDSNLEATARREAIAKAYEQGRKDEALAAYWGAPTYQIAEKNGTVLVWRMEEGWTK